MGDGSVTSMLSGYRSIAPTREENESRWFRSVLGGGIGRQDDVEGSAALGPVLRPLPAAMSGGDRATDRKTKTEAALLSGRERLEETSLDLRSDAAAGILDRDLDPLIVVGSGRDREGPRAGRRRFHRFAGIHHEIQDHLLELNPIAAHDAHSLGKIPNDSDLVGNKIAVCQIEYFGDYLVDLEGLERRLTFS